MRALLGYHSVLVVLGLVSDVQRCNKVLHDEWKSFREAMHAHRAILRLNPLQSINEAVHSFCGANSLYVDACVHNVSAFLKVDYPDLVERDGMMYPDQQLELFFSMSTCLMSSFQVDGATADVFFDKHDNLTALAAARCTFHQITGYQHPQCVAGLVDLMQRTIEANSPKENRVICRAAELRRSHTKLAVQLQAQAPAQTEASFTEELAREEVLLSSVSCVDPFAEELSAPCSCAYTNIYLRDGEWFFVTENGEAPAVFGGSGLRCLHAAKADPAMGSLDITPITTRDFRRRFIYNGESACMAARRYSLLIALSHIVSYEPACLVACRAIGSESPVDCCTRRETIVFEQTHLVGSRSSLLSANECTAVHNQCHMLMDVVIPLFWMMLQHDSTQNNSTNNSNSRTHNPVRGGGGRGNSDAGTDEGAEGWGQEGRRRSGVGQVLMLDDCQPYQQQDDRIETLTGLPPVYKDSLTLLCPIGTSCRFKRVLAGALNMGCDTHCTHHTVLMLY
jgi:hypothetical protein